MCYLCIYLFNSWLIQDDPAVTFISVNKSTASSHLLSGGGVMCLCFLANTRQKSLLAFHLLYVFFLFISVLPFAALSCTFQLMAVFTLLYVFYNL